MVNFLFILLLFIGCSKNCLKEIKEMKYLYRAKHLEPASVKKTYLEIDVFYEGDYIPENYHILGDVFVAPYDETIDAMLIDCSYDGVLNRVAEKTKELGGNAFKITDLKPPSFENPCYRVSALALNSNE